MIGFLTNSVLIIIVKNNMNVNIENPVPIFLSQLFPFLLSFADDALVLVFSRIGLHIHWLQWFSQVLLSCTLLYWVMKLWHHRYSIQQFLVTATRTHGFKFTD
jgi:hypothetical protein